MTRDQQTYEKILCDLCGSDQGQIIHRIEGKVSRTLSVLTDGHTVQLDAIATIVRCPICGLVYVNPRIQLHKGLLPYSVEAEEAYFRNTYSQRSYSFARLVSSLPVWLGRQPDRLLDLGCGDGALLEVCKQANINFVGAEVSDSLIQSLRDRFGERIIHVDELEFYPEGSFDVITLINVVEHLPSPMRVFRQVNHLLKPGGIFLIHVPNLGGVPARIYGKSWHQIQPLVHLYYFDPATLKKMLRAAGFTPLGRFSLLMPSSWKRWLQLLSDRLDLYWDNGLGMAARRV